MTGLTQRSGERLLHLARAALEPVLLPRGFAPAQGGSPDGELGITWCATYDDLAERLPHLPSSGEQPVGVGACVDVLLSARHDGTVWRLLDVALEGRDLASCLDRVSDRSAAARARNVQGTELEPALKELGELLDLLFVPGGAPNGVSRASRGRPPRE